MNKKDLFGGHSTDTHCKHPLLAWTVGYNEETGKKKIVVTGYDEVPYLRYNGRIYYERTEIPCGHCLSCRLSKSKEWANRMMLEAKEHENNYFLTLTYDNDHLPEPNELFDLDTGEALGVLSPINPLQLKDIQDFIKRLRKHFPDQKIRYYACGEYGSRNNRPHYHLILFGLNLPDDDLYEPDPNYSRIQNELGQKYYWSKTIDKLWTEVDPITKRVKKDENGDPIKLGIHCITSVNWETCAYTARYCTKKLYGDEAIKYKALNYPKEFSVMSRKPGIGYNFYKDNADMIYETDELFINLGEKGGKRIKPPRYYDRLYDIDYPDAMNIIKVRRSELASDSKKIRASATSLSYEDQLRVEEYSLKKRTDNLKRERSF